MDGNDDEWWQGASQKHGCCNGGRLYSNHELEDSHTKYTEEGDGMEKSRQSRATLRVALDHERQEENKLEKMRLLEENGC